MTSASTVFPFLNRGSDSTIDRSISSSTDRIHSRIFDHDLKIINHRQSEVNFDIKIEGINNNSSIESLREILSTGYDGTINGSEENNELMVESLPLPKGQYSFNLVVNETEINDSFPLSPPEKREYERIIIRFLPGKISISGDEI